MEVVPRMLSARICRQTNTLAHATKVSVAMARPVKTQENALLIKVVVMILPIAPNVVMAWFAYAALGIREVAKLWRRGAPPHLAVLPLILALLTGAIATSMPNAQLSTQPSLSLITALAMQDLRATDANVLNMIHAPMHLAAMPMPTV
jgi:hypothetical protein